MKRLLIKIGILSVIVTFAVTSFNLSVQAEKKKISGTAKTIRVTSQNNVSLKDVSGHVIYQAACLYTQTSSDPDWNDIQILEWEQGDEITGSGSHKGYDIELHKNGDETYIKFEGAHKMIKQAPDWEVAGEGKLWFIGGTEKFKDIKGGGTYKAKATPLGDSYQITFDWEAEVEY